MRKESYWSLFWQTGLPEAWMLSRPLESNPFSSGTTTGNLPGEHSDLPEEARYLRQKRTEPTAESVQRFPSGE